MTTPPSPKPAKGWTPERRAAQAERCRRNKPWKNATGPKTEAGKARASLNAFKHGNRSREVDDIRTLLRLNREFVKIFLKTLPSSLTNELKDFAKKPCKIKGHPHPTHSKSRTK